MQIRLLCFAVIPLLASAQPPAPTINFDGVIRSDTRSLGTLSPGTLFSVYGRHLGPDAGCHAEAGAAPHELCGVAVLIGEMPAELSYVSDTQINARVPDASPDAGAANLRVTVHDVPSKPFEVRLGPLPVKISLDGAAHAGGPVWLHVEYPEGGGVRYPEAIMPWEFKCDHVEVRRDGKELTAISPDPKIGGVLNGNPCGSIGFSAAGTPLAGRLPLHLRFNFDTPGTYEARYSFRFFIGTDTRWQSDWLPIEILPAAPRTIGPLPQDPAAILSDFLPNVLARRDNEALNVVLEYLYHPNKTVRGYAAMALYYWPDAEVNARLVALFKAKGPEDAVVSRLDKSQLPELAEAALPYLGSEDAVQMRGAMTVLNNALNPYNPPLPSQLRSRVELALVRAADHIVASADPQTLNDFVVTLGSAGGGASHQLLWSLVKRNVSAEQGVIVIAWRKDPADLPKLGELMQSPHDPPLRSLPYALRNAFGAAALPYLRDAMANSAVPGMHEACAEELMNAGDAAGFAYAREAIQQSKQEKATLISFLHDHYAQTRTADPAALLEFLNKPPAP